jgi:hypothetical protein
MSLALEIVQIYSSSIIGFLNSIHPIFYLKEGFCNWTLPLSSGEKSSQLGQFDGANPHPWAQLRMEAESSL